MGTRDVARLPVVEHEGSTRLVGDRVTVFASEECIPLVRQHLEGQTTHPAGQEPHPE